MPYDSNEVYVDEEGVAFQKGAIHVDRDGKIAVALLSAGQVEILCKVVGAVRE